MPQDLVVIGGASGFVGTALRSKLAARFRVVGLSRSAPPGDDTWRTGDLLNLRDAERLLSGARFAFYLVHSMLPSAKLTQASFADLDLICADNFARACSHAGVEQIVYLGGLVPERGTLSPHLESRREVEATLARYGTKVTTLRAGLLIGRGGSSFEMLTKLVRRLPAMVCPRWTLTRMQPVAVEDAIALLAFVVARPECYGETFDIGAPESLDYRSLMSVCAEAMHVRRRMLPIRLFTPSLSTLWVSLVTGAPRALVGPLVESLRHEMVARDLRLTEMAGLVPTPTRIAVERALAEQAASERPERESAAPRRKKAPPLVRSVQRMRLPAGRDAAWAADQYLQWVPRALRGLIAVDVDAERTCRFIVPLLRVTLLVLAYSRERSTPDRQLFFISGGALSRADQRGRLELRQVLDGETLLVAIHDYAPRLPWLVYILTQARFHAWVMAGFRRHLTRCQ